MIYRFGPSFSSIFTIAKIIFGGGCFLFMEMDTASSNKTSSLIN
jgi:hypothetical protein